MKKNKGIRVVRRRHKGNLTVDEPGMLLSVNLGNIEIKKSSYLVLRGVVDGSVVVDEGCKLFLSGVVTGNVYNFGLVEASGRIFGTLFNSGKAVIEPEADIYTKETLKISEVQ